MRGGSSARLAPARSLRRSRLVRIEEAYSKGREQRAQVRRDLELGKQRGRQDAERVTAEAERRTGRGNDGRTETAAYRAAQ